MKYLFLIFLLVISFDNVFSYQIAWRQVFPEINSYCFSRNGDEILIKKSNGFEILDRINGNKIRESNGTNYLIFSEDFKLGLIRNGDTFKIYNTIDNLIISSFYNKVERDSNLTKYSHFIFSPDNKYLIRSFSSYGTDMSHHFKSMGWIDIIDITNANVIKTIKGDSIESFGYISSIFFDKTDSNLLYFAESYFDLFEGDSSVSKKIFRYDLEKEDLSELYSITSNISNYYDALDFLRIFAFNPTGCAKNNDYIYPSFTVLPPYSSTYNIEEGIDIKSREMLNNTNLLMASSPYFDLEKFIVRLYKVNEYPAGVYRYETYNSIDIFSFNSKSANVSIAVNAINRWFVLLNPELKELIMFSDTIQTSVLDKGEPKEYFISPNPASDFIEISVETGSKPALTNDVNIFDVFGQNCDLTPTLSLSGEGARIDVSGLVPGMYFLRVGDRVGKFLKF